MSPLRLPGLVKSFLEGCLELDEPTVARQLGVELIHLSFGLHAKLDQIPKDEKFYVASYT